MRRMELSLRSLRIGVKVEDGVFVITEIQLSGKKRMSVKDYLNGKNIFEVGTQFE